MVADTVVTTVGSGAARVAAVAAAVAGTLVGAAAGAISAVAVGVAVGCVTLCGGSAVGPLATGNPLGPVPNRAPRLANAATVSTGNKATSGSAHHQRQRDSALPRTD
jgi:hypothetical protein